MVGRKCVEILLVMWVLSKEVEGKEIDVWLLWLVVIIMY